MLWGAKSFTGDISKWDVSRVTNMHSMFWNAASFNGDLSKWDVSSVTHMGNMFEHAKLFNGDISKWDVSSVVDMDSMFWDATSFTRSLCGAAWVESRAIQPNMFEGSSGSISSTACTTTPTFLPESKEELKSAIDACLKSSPAGECSDQYGPIGDWDVSRVTDMSNLFSGATAFN